MLKNLVQIINGCGGAETIEECAYLPMQMGATIIVVDAIWPQYRYPTGDPNYCKTSDLVAPDFRFEDLKSICDRNGWHYLKMDKFAFNGEQYNYALDYIERHEIPCDYLYFIDSDECLDPVYLDIWLAHIEECKTHNLTQLRFGKTIEILPEWKGVVVDSRVGGNYGILWGDALKVRREEFFDGNFHFKSSVGFGLTPVPLYHLHHFRKNAARRVSDGVFDTGGVAYDITQAPLIGETDYLRRLKEKFGDNFQIENQTRDSYIGRVMVDSNSAKQWDNAAQLSLEKAAITDAYGTLPDGFKGHPEIQFRLSEHLNFLDNYKELAPVNMQGYLMMRRHHFQVGRSLDRQISNGLAKAFPPALKSGYHSTSMFESELTPNTVNEAVSTLRRDGYWHAPFKLPKAIVQELTTMYDGLGLTKGGRNGVDEDVMQSRHCVRSVWLDSFFLHVAEDYFGVMPILDFVFGGRSIAAEIPREKQDQDALFWHCDKDRLCFLKVFIYLSDVGPTNGPHQYIVGSGDNYQEMGGTDRRFSEEEIRAKYPAESFREVCAEAGSIFIADTSTIHKGTVVREGHRDLLQTQYTTSLFGSPHKPLPYSKVADFGLTGVAKKFPRLFTRFQA